MSLTIEAGKEYRMRNGKKALVCAVLPPHPAGLQGADYAVKGYMLDKPDECTWQLDGGYCIGSPGSAYDLVAPWRDLVSVKGWINVYVGSTSYIYDTEEAANLGALKGRIACVYVTGHEGITPCR